jgi:hypothetical protein
MFTHIPAPESAFGISAIGSSNAPAKRPIRYAIAVAAGLGLFGALAAVGSAPALAQAQSHDAAMLPHYYDAEGGQHWGSWTAPAAEQKRAVSAVVKPTPRHFAQLHRFR